MKALKRQQIALFVLTSCLLLFGFFTPLGCGPMAGNKRGTHEGVPVDEEAIHNFCAYCHGMPPPEIFPRNAWKMEVERGYQFFEKAGLALKAPPLPGVVDWYEKKAPEKLDDSVPNRAKARGWITEDLPPWPETPPGGTAIAHLRYASKDPSSRPLLWAVDMRGGLICSWDPQKPLAWQSVIKGNHPCHLEPGDFDGDGLGDLLVSELGSFLPTDARKGRAVWHRGQSDGTFKETVLLENVGRVTDIKPLTSPGIWPMEFVVSAFGWNQTGEVWFVQIPALDADPKVWLKKEIDPRHGAIHILVRDWNGDGKQDFIALFGQEHECVTLYVNQGNGTFQSRNIYQGGHPGLGFSGIVQADLDGDGDVDLLLTNGDVLDQPYLLKPYHGVSWLENVGDLVFKHHSIGPMHGVHRALPLGRIEPGQGSPELVSVAFLPEEGFPYRKARDLPSVLLWTPKGKGQWEASVLESVFADHVTMAILSGQEFGRNAVAVGDFSGNKVPVKVFRRP